MQNKEGMSAQNIKDITLSGLIGGAVALALCAVLLFASSFLILKGALPEGSMLAVCIAVCAISGFIGAYFAARRGASFPALCALTAGVVFCLLLLLAAVVAKGSVQLGGANGGAMAAALVSGGLAGMAGTSKPKTSGKKTKKQSGKRK